MQLIKDFDNGILKVRLNDESVNYIYKDEYGTFAAMTAGETKKYFDRLKSQADYKVRMACLKAN